MISFARQHCIVGLLMALGGFARAADTHVLAPAARNGDLSRITVQMEVGGDLKVVSEGKVNKLPMSVAATLSYDELVFTAESEHLSSLRYYDKAEATIKIQKGGAKPALRDARRLIGADWGATGVLLFSPRGPLQRDELDLISLPANTLLIDALLPSDPMSVGESWKHNEPLMAAFLDLDAVSTSEVKSTLKDVAEGKATVEITGKLEGAAQGVSTKIELKGRYLYDFAQQRITQLTLLINEDRSIGHVATGLDVTSKMTLKIAPLEESKHLSRTDIDKVDFLADPASNPLVHESPTGGFRLILDRRWHAVHDETKLLTLRFVDRGDLLAQCNVAPMERASPGEHVSLERFQADIREALGKNFGQFVRATEGKDDLGRVIYRVVANGKVSDLAIEWHYYLVAERNGQQVAFAFTLEEGLVERFGDNDRLLVGGVEFFQAAAETAQPSKPNLRR